MMIGLAVAALVAAQVSAERPPTAGRVEQRSYESRVFGGTRRMLIYTPASAGQAQPPAWLLICLWGQDYAGEIGAPAAIETLVREGRIPPLTAVFLDDPDDRFQSFETTKAIAASVADELIPQLRRTAGITADARHTIVAGYSAAGLAATYAAFARPDVFGNVLAQSGAFWRGFEGDGASEPEWLANRFNAVAARDTRFYIEVGGLETVRPGGGSVTFKDANMHLRDVLLRKGYDVTFKEVPNARHEYGHWKAEFPNGLIALTSSRAHVARVQHP
jgi:enterochelin esterase-like enzyme